MKKLLLSALLSMQVAIAVSQTSECDCQPALDNDLKTVVQSSEYSEFKSWLSEYLMKDSTSQQSMKNQSGTKFSGAFQAVVKAVPVGGSGDYTKSKSKENQKYYRLRQLFSKNQYLLDSDINEFFTEYMSDNQLKGYLACLDLCAETSGNNVYLNVIGDTSDEFLIQVRYKSSGTFETITLKGNAKYVNLAPIGALSLTDGVSIPRGTSVSQYFKRVDPKKAASLTIDVKENLSPIKPVNLQPTTTVSTSVVPIGTIVASVLDYDKFMQANGFDKINRNDMKEVPWVPCDGRTLSVSKYSNYSGGPIPDLRGMFLRGINDYNVTFPTTTPVVNERKNPEPKVAGEFQSDSYQTHQHGYGANFLNGAGNQLWDVYGTKPAGGQWAAKINGGPAKNSNLLSLTSPEGGTETRPKNVTVYYYIKIN
ncbi:hypothetical protein [Dyadobacter sp. BHUBP1]|uniref:hypothetical protein n=1 Tax=Dyadobacter sp. BHUBP1 TaxID=3424178 RepID=UPI003D355BC8